MHPRGQSRTSCSATLPPREGTGRKCPASAVPPAPAFPQRGAGLGVGALWPGAHSWGPERLGRSPEPLGAQAQLPPLRPDVWKLPEGRLDLTSTPAQAYPPTQTCPVIPAPRPKLTQRRAPKSRSSWCRGSARYPGSAKWERSHTGRGPPPPSHPAGRAARTRRRARREGRPDAPPHALSRPGFCPSLARGAMKPRPLAPGTRRRRSSGSCSRGRGRWGCAAQARHAADGPPPLGCRGHR